MTLEELRDFSGVAHVHSHELPYADIDDACRPPRQITPVLHPLKRAEKAVSDVPAHGQRPIYGITMEKYELCGGKFFGELPVKAGEGHVRNGINGFQEWPQNTEKIFRVGFMAFCCGLKIYAVV
jgi:hypothetical protein